MAPVRFLVPLIVIPVQEIDRIATEIERVAKSVPGVSSALAERLNGGRYIDVKIDRNAAARYGLNIADVQSIVSSAHQWSAG